MMKYCNRLDERTLVETPRIPCENNGRLQLYPLLAISFICIHIFFAFDSDALTITPPISGHEVNPNAIQPSDVLSRVNLVAKELELVRMEMGLRTIRAVDRSFENASPREVFFGALKLYKKANRLGLEQVSIQGADPVPVKTWQVRSYHVWNVVNQALTVIRKVKLKMDIHENPNEDKSPDSTTPNDVLQALLETNRSLNHLLYRPISPNDVYIEINRSIGYADRLLEKFPTAERLRKQVPYLRRVKTSELYLRLVQSMNLLQRILNLSEEKTLTLIDPSIEKSWVQSSDVLDLAALVTSELAFLHSTLQNTIPPRVIYFPGNQLNSNAYQRLGVLNGQLTELLIHIPKDNDWRLRDN